MDTLAFHFSRSEDDLRARGYLMRAGQRAERLYANDEALAYFRSALERSTGEAEAQASAHEAIGDVQRRMAAYEDALASFQAALDLRRQDEDVARANLLRKSGAVHDRTR